MQTHIQEKVNSAKRYTYQLLEQAFVELEADLYEKLHRVNSDEGLHSVHKAEKIDHKLNSTLAELYSLR